MIRFLPSYVGSKKHWIPFLEKYRNRDFVELFCGSAVLSANLAKTALLNDLDPKIYQILSNFDQLIVPEIFTCDDFLAVRTKEDWWKWAYCLQKMSFSGVFRYSKNGYNVPIKTKDKVPTIKEIRIKEEFLQALSRWKQLNPEITNRSYEEIDFKKLINKVVILDPPYEGSKASYNSEFNYSKYWNFIKEICNIEKITIIVFDRERNLKRRGIPIVGYKKMTVNGQYDGDIESVAIFENGKWQSDLIKPNDVPLTASKAKIKDKTVSPIPNEPVSNNVSLLIKKRGRPKGSKNRPKNTIQKEVKNVTESF